jgi:hypothetical protein
MGDVINLNKYRKQLRKEEKTQKSAVNKVRFGRVKADKDLVMARQVKDVHLHDLKKIEPIPFDKPDEDDDQTESDPA